MKLKPVPYNRAELLSDIKKGEIQIPQFQREFVWSVAETVALLDSILKDYPTGSFIFWRTKERFRTLDFGGEQFPKPEKGEYINYVLDGQQRLTSIYACTTGKTINNKDYSKIVVDLDASEEDESVVLLEKDKKAGRVYIPMADLVSPRRIRQGNYTDKHLDKIDQYGKILNNHPFSVIEFKHGDLSVATEVFTRINVRGKPLDTFQIMVAKTYDAERNFDLADKTRELLADFEKVGYGTVPRETVLRTVSAILSGDCGKKAIFALHKDEFINAWDSAASALKSAIDHFRNVYQIKASRLLPYYDLLVPFAYFFHQGGKQAANADEYLTDFFWRCSLTERYSFASETKLTQDIKKMDSIHAGELPAYEEPLPLTLEWIIAKGQFKINHSFIKAILCLYAGAEPRDFDKHNKKVSVGNDTLLRGNSKNYHHFFPKGYLRKQPLQQDAKHLANHVLNITIVSEKLNKRDIGAKPPSVYMKTFADKNNQISETMRSHLIDDLKEFGVFTDDLRTFCHKRAERVIAEIKGRVIIP